VLDSIYTSCIEVLGKPRDHVAFHQLAEKFTEEPVLAMENEHVAYYDFPQYGIELIYKKSRACFSHAVFFVDSPNVRQREMQRYPGVFLAGVTTNDSMKEVERKIDAVSTHYQLPDESTLRYELHDQKVTFFFDGPGRQLKLVLVKLRFDVNP